MKFEKLRIVWSVGWGILCLLLIGLWVRSYGTAERLDGRFWNGYSFLRDSKEGRVTAVIFRWPGSRQHWPLTEFSHPMGDELVSSNAGSPWRAPFMRSRIEGMERQTELACVFLVAEDYGPLILIFGSFFIAGCLSTVWGTMMILSAINQGIHAARLRMLIGVLLVIVGLIPVLWIAFAVLHR